MTSIRILAAIVLILAGALWAQTALTNESVVKLVKAGLSEDLVISTINAQPCRFSITPDDLIQLKQAGVTEKVIAVMLGKASSPSSAAPAAPAAAGAAPVSEVGVYYMKGGTWADLSPEVVNFKTGGVLKTLGTVGIVKGDVNGHIAGAHSKNLLKTPVELLVYVPEGVAIAEYQLLRLHAQHDSREFRTVTGGVMHVSGGQTRDALVFDSKKIAPRTHQITLSALAGGEYGLLPPASSDSTASSGRIGKIYSFQVLE